MISGPPLKGFIYRNGKVGPFESHLTMGAAFKLLGRLIAEPFIPRTKKEDESIHHWATRRLGEYATHYGVDPMISGIYAGDLTKLSARSCLPRFWNYEQNSGSLLRGSVSLFVSLCVCAFSSPSF